jgi:F0F1-type ATP synthase epsilon subunit
MEYKTDKTLSVTIKTKEKTLYNGVAITVSSSNVSGPFDILPDHANFISLIHSYLIINKEMEGEKKFDLEKGVMYVMSDKIEVYLGI